jgi:phosphohistidine phosphatase SixA
MPNLYLMRHGEAEAGRGKPDFQRELTPRGISDCMEQALKMKRLAAEIGTIIHSPYVRARQTAELINEQLTRPMRELEYLVPNGAVEDVVTHISGDDQALLLVCHLPIIAEIAYAYTKKSLPFFPGTVAKIKRGDAFTATGELEWQLNP